LDRYMASDDPDFERNKPERQGADETTREL
jgi:hypothetical protein